MTPETSAAARRLPVPSHGLRMTRVGPGTVVLAFDLNTPELPRPILERLTRAEREVASLAVEGLSDEDIAERTGRSRHTVSNLLRRGYKRLGVDGRVALAALVGSAGGTQAAGVEPQSSSTPAPMRCPTCGACLGHAGALR